jgi:hypothetical protein
MGVFGRAINVDEVQGGDGDGHVLGQHLLHRGRKLTDVVNGDAEETIPLELRVALLLLLRQLVFVLFD